MKSIAFLKLLSFSMFTLTLRAGDMPGDKQTRNQPISRSVIKPDLIVAGINLEDLLKRLMSDNPEGPSSSSSSQLQYMQASVEAFLRGAIELED